MHKNWGNVIIAILGITGFISSNQTESTYNYYYDITREITSTAENGSTVMEHGMRVDVNGTARPYNFFFYSTGLLLNEINELDPVINFVAKLGSPKPHRFILSLAYTKQNRFDWRRINDVFYELSIKLAQNIDLFLSNNLHSIVLDFTTDACQEDSIFFSRVTVHHGFGFEETLIPTPSLVSSVPYSFPDYVRNFVQFYCSNCSSVSIGVAYGLEQIFNCSSNFLKQQVKAADFLTLPVTFNTDGIIPVSYNIFETYMKSLEEQHEVFLGGKLNKTVMFIVKVNSKPVNVTQARKTWQFVWNDLESLISNSEYYLETVGNQLKTSHSTSISFLRDFFMEYCRDKEKCEVVFDAEIATDKKDDFQENQGKIIPQWYTTEVNETAQSLKETLKKMNSDRVVIDFGTWRTLLRYSENLNGEVSKNGSAKQGRVNASRAILIVERDLLNIWEFAEAHLIKFLTQDNNVSMVQVDAVVIPEEFANEATTRFLRMVATKMNLSVGCQVHLNEAKLEVLKLKMVFSEGTNFAAFMKSLGGEVFEMATILVWNLEGLVDPRKLELVAVTREIFHKEFPEKEIVLKMSNLLPVDFVKGWAKFYNVSVIY